MLGGQECRQGGGHPPMEGDPYPNPQSHIPPLVPPLSLQTCCFSSFSLAFVFKSFHHKNVKCVSREGRETNPLSPSPAPT